MLRLQSPLNKSYIPLDAAPNRRGLTAIQPNQLGTEIEKEVARQKNGAAQEPGDRRKGEICTESGSWEQHGDLSASDGLCSKPIHHTRPTDSISYEQREKDRRSRPENGLSDPRRGSKSRACTPTEYLIDTLQNAHQFYGAKSRNWTSMTEYTKLMVPLTQRQRDNFQHFHRLSLQEIVADYIHLVDPLLDPASSRGDPPATSEWVEALQLVFCEENLKYLAARRYSVTDVVGWAWVLKSGTPYEAIFRVLLWEADRSSTHGGSMQTIPPFIPLLLLRQSLDTKAFRLLLIYSLHLMTGQPVPTSGMAMEAMSNDAVFDQHPKRGSVKPMLEPNMCVTYVVRLLHHARELWPQAQLTIARAFAFYLDSLQGEGDGVTERVNQFMADKFNTVLRILSLPCRHGPFKSASIQQQAQFELLRAMARHQPVLPVTRRGYQGIIAVQIAHKKTFAERQSAELKAASWPPWKEDKIGFDVKRGVEGMKSRAMRVLSQMKEAGYSQSRWEEASSILAGWDTDKSPTIQTRSLVSRPETLHGSSGHSDHRAIWAARIRATRTVREAWACFLSYQEQGLPPRGAIYAAMAEKLVFQQETAHSNFQTSEALPGDGKEVFPEPSSIRDWIYVSTEPPPLDDFLREMLSNGIRPGGRFLALLLRHAQTFGSGLDYLSCSELTNEQLEALCTVSRPTSSAQARIEKALGELPNYLISSFITFLCRFANIGHRSSAHPDTPVGDVFPILLGRRGSTPSNSTTLFTYAKDMKTWEDPRHPKLLAHAVQLVQAQRSRSPQMWIQIMSALVKDRVGGRYHRLGRHARLVFSWYEVLELTSRMDQRRIELSLEGFQTLCYGFTRVVAVGIRNPDSVEEGLEAVGDLARRGRLTAFGSVSPQFADMVQSGLITLKARFDELVFLDPKTSSLFERSRTSIQHATASQVTVPPLFHVPSPAVLHTFVRALGVAEDTEGLLSLLRWMQQYELTLKEKYDENMNGERIMRRTMVAIRMFLEGDWGRSPQVFDGPENLSTKSPRDLHGWCHEAEASDSSEGLTFSDPNLQEAYDIIGASRGWSWPSDEEVLDYIAHGEQESQRASDRYTNTVH
ncbi:hypothetical protein BO70DRAFT_327528 [Aspergillus heteromorphus CBS 117.55]|uniref:Uncharacterized protein n=1 Tax=Aspergillus heteromorphus CBS 117.55 TaxID=1448321 RepID=A0A317X155_9EURO|nr:uncharacterized protein BO70DRAFT_327528 [Aspergillus heteromorphus CBS 117.55]PWY92399.1 hypothetical protein BO70DRAFT_327528 [Aspergillus heteromorphus CBS 117.55]